MFHRPTTYHRYSNWLPNQTRPCARFTRGLGWVVWDKDFAYVHHCLLFFYFFQVQWRSVKRLLHHSRSKNQEQTFNAKCIKHLLTILAMVTFRSFVFKLEMSWNVFFNHIPSHSRWFIPISIPNPRFSLALFPFPSHLRWLFPFPPAPIVVLLVVSHQITNDRWT